MDVTFDAVFVYVRSVVDYTLIRIVTIDAEYRTEQQYTYFTTVASFVVFTAFTICMYVMIFWDFLICRAFTIYTIDM